MRKMFQRAVLVRGGSWQVRKWILGLVMVVALVGAGLFGVGVGSTSQVKAQKIDKSFYLCDSLSGKPAQQCRECMGNDKKNATKFWSGVGCLPVDAVSLGQSLIRICFGVAGLLLMAQVVMGAGEIIFSSGDSQKLQNAQKRVTNSIIAILFIVFGVAILQIIGVNILKIPGFFGN